MSDRYEKIRKALAECRDIAMEWTLRGRTPECGKFGEIAQELDVVCSELENSTQQHPITDAERDQLAAALAHPAITHCEGCGCDWLDNGLNPVGCPYCKQSAAVDDVVVERIAALLHEETTGEPWTVAGVEHPGPDRDYYRGLARKVAALAAHRKQGDEQ